MKGLQEYLEAAGKRAQESDNEDYFMDVAVLCMIVAHQELALDCYEHDKKDAARMVLQKLEGRL